MNAKLTAQIKDARRTGVAVPISALQTKESLGCGEFLDLIPFADFCLNSGLSLIQILPVNDTGTESSPYSALSAFALHPIYIRVSKIKEFSLLSSNLSKAILNEIEEKKREFTKEKRFNYKKLRLFKLSLLKRIWEEISAGFISSESTKKWLDDNPWLQTYASFMVLKEKNREASFKTWDEYADLTKAEIAELWDVVLSKEDLYFHVWIQKNASEQLQEASKYCKAKNILLKGDIPILMNEDSADIWAYPEFFQEDLRAGSPPDGENPFGQNWGFPIYNWEELKKQDYSWWKERLIEAAKYYQMYRIDHILGFFRIWAVPKGESKAILGWTIPNASMSTEELLKCGLSKETIRWLSKPHVATREIEEVNNGDYLGTHGILATCMDRIGSEELWLFKESIKTDADIWSLDIPHKIKEKLAEKWLDRALIEIKKDAYLPLWTYENTTSWKTLDNEQVSMLRELFTKKEQKQNMLWEKQAKELLGALSGVGNMIACAEDLGVNLQSMPRVLESLSINALRVVRWNRLWEKEDKPFVPFTDYPALSVSTSSVHDSSTLRGWWDKEPDSKDFGRSFFENGKQSLDYIHELFSPLVCQKVLSIMATTKSNYFINPIQDFLYLDALYYAEKSEDERINIPGTVSEFNWTYKLPVLIEDLAKNKDLIQKIKEIVSIHKKSSEV
ncbi:MAG TPA: 4-alpha-glucanotransferase [Treponemataceae bacterium]|nr:4-alpha-glucanotransferase [Treponemataceae bacterium]